MYDLTSLKLKTYKLKLTNGKVISVYDPKMKLLRKLSTLLQLSVKQAKSNSEEAFKSDDKAYEVLVRIFSNNKEHYKVTREMFEDLTSRQITELMEDFIMWVSDIKKN